MIFLRVIFGFLERARRESSPTRIALGVTVGFFLGLIPPMTLHWICCFAILLVFRVNMLAAVISWATFFIVGVILQAQFDDFGYYLLVRAASLQEFWAWMYHAPILPYTRFNNTVTAGSTFFALVGAVPVFLVTIVLVKKFRSPFANWFYDSLVWRSWLNSRVRIYYERAR